MAWVSAILNALIAIPKICDYVEKFVAEVIYWYVGKQKKERLQDFADAAAFAAHATTKEERFKASEKWRTALSKPRVSA